MSTNCEFKPGDILFGKLRPNLRKGIRVSFPGYCSTDILVLRARDGIDPGFAAHVLRWDSVFSAAISTAAGTKMPRTSWRDLKRFEVLCPERMEDQRLVAAILDTADEALAATEAVIAKLKQVRAGLLHDLLTRGLDEHGQLRDPLAHPEHFHDSPLGRIPREWEVGTICDFCELHNELRQPIAGRVREQMAGIYPYFGPTGVLDYIDEYRVEGQYVLIGEDGDHFLKFATQPMTLLVEGRFNVNNHAHILCGRGRCTTPWIQTFFCHRDLKRHLLHQGAGRLKLNQASLLSIPMAVPDKHEQREIRRTLDEVDQAIGAENREFDKLAQVKSGLMTDLLTGRVRVPADISAGANGGGR